MTPPNLREKLEFAALSVGAWLIARLLFRLLSPLAKALGPLAFLLDPWGRGVALANIEAAFPGKFSAARKSAIARGSYVTFARTMLEIFWAPNIDEKFLNAHVVFEGSEQDYCRNDPNKPAIYACFHFGNFEWLAIAVSYSISPLPVIAQQFRNPLLGPVFDRLRSFSGNQVVPQKRAMLRMLKHLKGGGKFGMLCDLNLDPREGSVLVESFGGLLSSVTQTHAALAQRTGAAIIPVVCLPGPKGKYRIIYRRPIECPRDADVQAIVQECWDALEPAVHEHPEYWLWAYKHWRYKPEEGGDRYPSYANISQRFQKLVDQK